MGAKTSEVGGGAATGLSNDFVKWLSQGLNTGTFGTGAPAGADAYGATNGIGAYLNDVLSGGAGKLGGSLAQTMNTETERNAAALRARFGVGGGGAFGTPGAFAEGLFRSEQAPKLTQAIGGLQQNALQMLLPLFAQLSDKGIAQRQLVTQQSPWATAAGIAAPLIAGGLTLATGGAAAPLMGAASMATAGAGAQTSILNRINSGGFGQDWQLPSIQPMNFTPSLMAA